MNIEFKYIILRCIGNRLWVGKERREKILEKSIKMQ